MQNVDIVDCIVFGGISQGIFLAITIQLIQNKNRIANKVLSLLLGIASIMLMGKFLYAIDSKIEWFFRVAIFLDTLIFVFGPFLYLYFRRLVFNETPRYKLSFYYFIPIIGMSIYYIWTLTYSHQELIQMLRQGKFETTFFIIETLGISFNYYFCYRCYKVLRKYKKEEKENLSYSQNALPFLRTVLIAGTLFFTMWLFSYISTYFLKTYSAYINYNTVWIAFPMFIYVVGFYSLKQPDIFRLPFIKPKVRKSKNRLEGEELIRLKNDLENLMVHKKIYLNHELTLVDLAQQLDTSTNNVSWLLNNIHNCNFYDYINRYRVQEFIKKVENKEHQNHTLLALSLDSGFSSKSTFNKAFKARMNDTPSNYIKKLKAA